MGRVAIRLRNVMFAIVLGICFSADFCSAESALDEGIYIFFDGERVNIDDIVCDSGKLISVHKHKIYCIKCLGCDPRKHHECKSRCKCKHPKLR